MQKVVQKSASTIHRCLQCVSYIIGCGHKLCTNFAKTFANSRLGNIIYKIYKKEHCNYTR